MDKEQYLQEISKEEIIKRLTDNIPKRVKLFLIHECDNQYKKYYKDYKENIDYHYNKLIEKNLENIYKLYSIISLFYKSTYDVVPSYFDEIIHDSNCDKDVCISSTYLNKKYIDTDEFYRVRDLITNGCLVIQEKEHDFSLPYSEYKNHVCKNIDIIDNVILSSFNDTCVYCYDYDVSCLSKITNLVNYKLNNDKLLYFITPTQVMMTFFVCGFNYTIEKCRKHKVLDLHFEACLDRPTTNELEKYIEKYNQSKKYIISNYRLNL